MTFSRRHTLSLWEPKKLRSLRHPLRKQINQKKQLNPKKMPFKSQAQRAWMYANQPERAKKWESETPKKKKLPKKKRKR